MRLTKIIATLGPACAGRRSLERLVRAGIDVARLNFSHGTHAEHARNIRDVRAASARTGRCVAILADLQGPRVRVGRLGPDGERLLRRGATIRLTPGPGAGEGALPTTLPSLARNVRPGERLLLDDGRLELRVLRVRGREVVCRVVVGGLLREHKGINLPLSDLRVPSFTAKDRRDLTFAVRHGVDAVALSFVRGPEDVGRVRRHLAARGVRLPLFAKIELRAALRRLGGILREADGVMVARGDLGVEVPLERVPVLQKQILRQAAKRGALAITATQMLESMVTAPRPTRAEASDVANAVFDGTDAVMLSAETAAGRHPAGAVRVMGRIARAAEHSPFVSADRVETASGPDVTAHAVARSARDAAREYRAGAIVVFTRSGRMARLLSAQRPGCPIVALTPHEGVRRGLAFARGVVALRLREQPTTDRMLLAGEREILRRRTLRRGTRVVVVSGTSTRSPSAHFMKLHRLGGGS